MFDCNVQLLLGEAFLKLQKELRINEPLTAPSLRHSTVLLYWHFVSPLRLARPCCSFSSGCDGAVSVVSLFFSSPMEQKNLSRACLLWEHLWSVFQECYIKYQQCFSKGFTFVSYNVRYPTVCFDFHIIAHILAKSQPSGIFARPVALKLFSLFCSQSKCHYGYKFLDFVVTYRHPLNMTCEANSNHILL